MTCDADHEAAAILIAFCVSRTAGESSPSGDVNVDVHPPGASGEAIGEAPEGRAVISESLTQGACAIPRAVPGAPTCVAL